MSRFLRHLVLPGQRRPTGHLQTDCPNEPVRSFLSLQQILFCGLHLRLLVIGGLLLEEWSRVVLAPAVLELLPRLAEGGLLVVRALARADDAPVLRRQRPACRRGPWQ